MSKYSNFDHYTDPTTGVLYNKLEITEADALEKAEAEYAALRSYELLKNPIPGSLDFNHLKSIHKYLFQDLYAWAGEVRSIDISKGDNFFAHFPHIEKVAESIFTRLSSEKSLKALPIQKFCERAAFYLSEINALHPFREGNGRVQREFFGLLARNNGMEICWKNIPQAEMLQASMKSFSGDYSELKNLILANTRVFPTRPGRAKSAIKP